MSASDTPRVDAAEKAWKGRKVRALAAELRGSHLESDDPPVAGVWDTARQLERELSAANESWKQRDEIINSLNQNNAGLEAGLAAVREKLSAAKRAGEGLVTALQTIADSHDSPDNDSIAREALSAYEATKP